MTDTSLSQSSAVMEALGIADEAWDEIRRGTYVQRALGGRPTSFPDLSENEAQRKSARARALLIRIARLRWAALPHDVELTLRVVAFRAQAWAREESWYWNLIDPLGIGIYGMFLPTAYCGGWLLTHLHGQLGSFPFSGAEDAAHYLDMIEQYSGLLQQFTARTKGQRARGMRMPLAQARQAIELFTGIRARLGSLLCVSAERLKVVDSAKFTSELNACIVGRVEPAFDALLVCLSDEYVQRAQETVGLGQCPGGEAIYEELVKLYTTLELSPGQIHARGHVRMIEIERDMSVIRAQMGFAGDNAAFLSHLARDPRWRDETATQLTKRFDRYIDRISPRLSDCFERLPKAACEVLPLPETLQGSMTYGYYDPPQQGHARGQYFFNSRNLAERELISLPALTYHELVPGHHLQLALQQEDSTLHPVRRYSIVNAYVEGWAEYAAYLADELGGYECPEERYGRLVRDAFLTCRLVVDTGLNAMGWSLKRAQTYMKEHTAMADAEIHSDSLRYSCDIPGHALAYKLGDTKILELRSRMQSALGARFSLKAFHARVLEAGAVPMMDLDWHVESALGVHYGAKTDPELLRSDAQ